MEQLIADLRPLNKHFWHGGDTSEPFITPESEEDEPILVGCSRKPNVVFKKTPKMRPPTKVDLKPRSHLREQKLPVNRDASAATLIGHLLPAVKTPRY